MTVATGRNFAERLKELRLAAGLNQAQLAEKAGLSFQAVSMLEGSKREPSWSTVQKLARALGVSLLAFEVEPPAESREPDGSVERPKIPPISKRK